jgi:hypothetical protein
MCMCNLHGESAPCCWITGYVIRQWAVFYESDSESSNSHCNFETCINPFDPLETTIFAQSVVLPSDIMVHIGILSWGHLRGPDCALLILPADFWTVYERNAFVTPRSTSRFLMDIVQLEQTQLRQSILGWFIWNHITLSPLIYFLDISLPVLCFAKA